MIPRLEMNVKPIIEKIIEKQMRKWDIEQRALVFALLRTRVII
jgi:hypothetical protein